MRLTHKSTGRTVDETSPSAPRGRRPVIFVLPQGVSFRPALAPLRVELVIVPDDRGFQFRGKRGPRQVLRIPVILSAVEQDVRGLRRAQTAQFLLGCGEYGAIVEFVPVLAVFRKGVVVARVHTGAAVHHGGVQFVLLLEVYACV